MSAPALETLVAISDAADDWRQRAAQSKDVHRGTKNPALTAIFCALEYAHPMGYQVRQRRVKRAYLDFAFRGVFGVGWGKKSVCVLYDCPVLCCCRESIGSMGRGKVV